MATRALRYMQNTLHKLYTVKNGVTITKGKRVRFGATDAEVDNVAGADDDTMIGTAMDTGTGNAAGTVKIKVAYDFHQIVPMIVGTGGATRGVKAKVHTDGVIDAPTNGGGTVSRPIVGVFLQSGVVGDLVGVGVAASRSVSA